METNQNLYNQRLNRLITTTNHQEPDRVPIINFAETYCISYANSSVEDCLKDPQKEFEVYAQLHKDVYMDATFGMCINRAMNVFQVLENNAYFISEDGTTIQHQEVAPMLETEYPAFAKDPISFGRNVIFPRKYAPLNQAYPKNLEALKSAALAFADYAKKMGDASEYAKETLGLPTLAGTPIFAPVDFIMDYLRGFRGIQLDMRRRPEELAEAAEALVPIMIQVASMGKPRLDPFPFVFNPLHLPTFLGPKQFGKHYWPSYKKVLLAIHEMGGKVLAMLEGDWHNFYEFLQELPKSMLIGAVEKDDLAVVKKEVGDTITLVGGVPLSMLRHNSKQQCIDETKRVLDHCAPGGGFIFANDKSLLSPGDIKIENLIAVNQYVKENGTY